MHLFDFCELRGSGIDRAIKAVEDAYLPAPEFIKGTDYTKVCIYPKKTFAQMSREDRIRSCYQHCCLKFIEKEPMSNQSLRVRMEIDEDNAAMVSRIIKDTVNSGFIKVFNPDNTSRKHAKYIPFWA